MWCPEGYITLREIIFQFYWDCEISPAMRLERNLDLQELVLSMSEDRRAWVNWLLLAFFREFSHELRACLPSGAIVRLTPLALSWAEDGNYWSPEEHSIEMDRASFPELYEARVWLAGVEFRYIDLRTGCIKNFGGDCKDEISLISKSPICIREADLPVDVEKLSEWLIDDVRNYWTNLPVGKKPDYRSGNVAQEIVSALQAERILTKGEARRMFGRDLKTDAWNALWGEVTEIYPYASRPGPRRKKKSFG